MKGELFMASLSGLNCTYESQKFLGNGKKKDREEDRKAEVPPPPRDNEMFLYNPLTFS